MENETKNSIQVEADINKLIDIITRNPQGVMELDQVREDQDHPETKYRIRITRDYDKNRVIVTYAEFVANDKKPSDITQIIISFFQGTDGGTKDSIKKIKIKTTIRNYTKLKWFLADEYEILHINEIMKFAYVRLLSMKLVIEQESYPKMFTDYQRGYQSQEENNNGK